MKRTGKRLKTDLYGIPILLVFVMALTIYIVFNLAVNSYVARLAERNIEARFNRLDAYYHSSEYAGYYDEGSDFIITVRHIILDDTERLLYPSAPWESETEQEQTEEILARYSKNRTEWDGSHGRKLTMSGKTLYLMQRVYTGYYDGAFIIERKTGDAYSVLAYMDISPIADFLRLVNRLLFLLMGVLSVATASLLLSAGKGLDRSFQTLKSYILRAGERKPLSPADVLPYAEFNEITDTVFQMSQKIEEAEEAQVKFFQNASHELRTPLTAIRGYAEGISSGVIGDAKASAAIIMEHSDKMSALVDELLYTSKLDTHMEADGNETFDLREAIGRCVWSMEGKAESEGVQISLNLPDEAVLILGSEKMMERALSNILSNAVRYAWTEINVSLSTMSARAVVTVEDDGKGISADDLPHIFERFYKGRGGVSGLGLSITQEAVRRHGGTVTAASTEGHTVFTVTLPLRPA